jgi:hypothetical protein
MESLFYEQQIAEEEAWVGKVLKLIEARVLTK